MYLAKLTKEGSCNLFNTKENIKFWSDSKDEATYFCNEWNSALVIARKMKYIISGYPNGYPTYWESCEDDDSFRNREMLIKVVRRCLKEQFPIGEYCLHEIPYSDKEGWIMDFVHYQEFTRYHAGDHSSDIHEISFWVPLHNDIAVPQKSIGCEQSDAETCWEAVYIE